MVSLADLRPGLIVDYFDSHAKKWKLTKVVEVDENGVRLAGRATVLRPRDIAKRILLKGESAAGSEVAAAPEGGLVHAATRKRGELGVAWQEYARKWVNAFHNDLEKIFEKLGQDCTQDQMKQRLASAIPKMEDSVYAQFQRPSAAKDVVQGHVHPSADLAFAIRCFERSDSNSKFYCPMFSCIIELGFPSIRNRMGPTSFVIQFEIPRCVVSYAP